MKKSTMLIVVFISVFSLSQTVKAQTEEFNIAKVAIMGYDEVSDAAISKQGDKLSLVLIVNYSTSAQRAKELGDNFVRLTMTFVKAENKPSKEIGKSVYDYLIGVYYPNEKEVVMGAKVSYASRISW